MPTRVPTLAVSAAWIGSSQVIMRLIRIVATILVARLIAPELLGVAAISLAANEVAHVFFKNATNARIIRSAENELNQLCDTAYFINWFAGITLFALQFLIGYVLSIVYDDNTIFLLVGTLSFCYLLFPFAQVQAGLNLRAEKIPLISKIEVQQTIADAALTIVMLLLGFGVWSLVVPKLLVVPVWIRAHKRECQWKAPNQLVLTRVSELLTFNSRVLAVEVLGVVRHNIDYVLVGYFLGMHALGIYYFAYNAGLGLTRGFIISLNNAFYPYLCSVKDSLIEVKTRFQHGLLLMLALMIPLLCAQAYFAEFYVPVLFGQHWVERNAVQLVQVLCLAGVPLVAIESGSQYMRALGKPSADLQWHSTFTTIFAIAIYAGSQLNLMGVVLAVLSAQFIAAPLYLFYVLRIGKSNETSHLVSDGKGYI